MTSLYELQVGNHPGNPVHKITHFDDGAGVGWALVVKLQAAQWPDKHIYALL